MKAPCQETRTNHRIVWQLLLPLNLPENEEDSDIQDGRGKGHGAKPHPEEAEQSKSTDQLRAVLVHETLSIHGRQPIPHVRQYRILWSGERGRRKAQRSSRVGSQNQDTAERVDAVDNQQQSIRLKQSH